MESINQSTATHHADLHFNASFRLFPFSLGLLCRRRDDIVVQNDQQHQGHSQNVAEHSQLDVGDHDGGGVRTLLATQRSSCVENRVCTVPSSLIPIKTINKVRCFAYNTLKTSPCSAEVG